MKKITYSIVAIMFLAAIVAAQQAEQKPQSDESPVKISTNLIQLDVTVTDRNGKVVTGMEMPDFEVFENGEKQKVTNLSFVSKTKGGAAVSANDGSVNDSGKTQGLLTSNQVRRTIAIVVDDLNLSFASVYYTRRALRRFVDTQMEPNDLVAIIRTGGSVGALQQFTSDKRLLYAAIEKIRWNPLGNGGVDSLTSVGQNAKEITERFATESDYVASKSGNDSSNRKTILTRPNITDVKATDYDQTRALNDLSAAIYAQAALGTIKYIVSGMNELPGRKMMMLFSDGFAIRSDANKSRSSMVYQYLQDLVDFTNRSSVVVYTFDTRGLQTSALTASDSTYEIIDGHREAKQLVRLNDFRSNQDGLAYYAGQTGGKALLNSNDLNGGIQRALEEQSGYYLIGYMPDADAFDPAKRRFNKLEVKVTRPGLNVSYRSGFFNTNTAEVINSTISTETQMAKALTSPFVLSEITLSMNALYADDPKDGAYIRSFLHIDANDLKFSEDADGWKKAAFEVTAVTFGDNGTAIENVDSSYTIRTKGATYDAMLKKGFVYVLIMPVKKPGVYQYRVALRDTGSGKIGSASQVVEVPDLTKNKLSISSVAVEGVSPAIWQSIAQGKVGTNPGQVQVASTLLYDTVIKQFPAGTVLRYGYEVYNAKPGDGSIPRLETQIKILQNNRTVVEGNLTKFDASSQADAKHLRLSGAVMLNENLSAGDYVLQIIVNDTVSKQRAVQLFPFEITK